MQLRRERKFEKYLIKGSLVLAFCLLFTGLARAGDQGKSKEKKSSKEEVKVTKKEEGDKDVVPRKQARPEAEKEDKVEVKNESQPPLSSREKKLAMEEDSDSPPPPPEKNKSISFGFSYYNQDDGNGKGGNPYEKQDETVLTPIIIFKHTVNNQWSYKVKAQVDVVSSASMEDFPEGTQSGASGDFYVGARASTTYSLEDWKFTAGVGFATEYDFTSVNGSFSLVRELFDDHTKLFAGLEFYHDQIDIIPFTGISDGSDTRDTLAINLGWTQIINRRLLANLSLGVTNQTGFLSVSSFNSVFVGGSEEREVLPDSRIRYLAGGRILYSFNKISSLELGGKFYTDDWGITGVGAEVRYNHYFFDRHLLARLRYRIYNQQESKYYAEEFATAQEYMTSDSDLGDFTSHTGGLKLVFMNYIEDFEFSLSFNYFYRDDGFNIFYTLFQFQYKF